RTECTASTAELTMRQVGGSAMRQVGGSTMRQVGRSATYGGLWGPIGRRLPATRRWAAAFRYQALGGVPATRPPAGAGPLSGFVAPPSYLAAVDPESADMATDDIAEADRAGQRIMFGAGRLSNGPLRGSRRRLLMGRAGWSSITKPRVTENHAGTLRGRNLRP